MLGLYWPFKRPTNNSVKGVLEALQSYGLDASYVGYHASNKNDNQHIQQNHH